MFLFFVSSAGNQVIPPIRWNDQIQHLSEYSIPRNEWVPVLVAYQTQELGPSAGRTHSIPPYDSNQTHPKFARVALYLALSESYFRLARMFSSVPSSRVKPINESKPIKRLFVPSFFHGSFPD